MTMITILMMIMMITTTETEEVKVVIREEDQVVTIHLGTTVKTEVAIATRTNPVVRITATSITAEMAEKEQVATTHLDTMALKQADATTNRGEETTKRKCINI